MKILCIISAILIFSISQKSVAQTNSVSDDLKKAKELVADGKTEEASKIYVQLMQSQPDNKEAVQGWLIANMKRSPTGEEEAINTLADLHKSYPKNTGIIFFKAYLEAEHGRNEDALTDLNKLIVLQPDTALNYVLKGQVLMGMEKYKDAAVAFERATTLDPKRPDVWGMKAVALAKTGKYDEALASVNKVIGLVPGNPVDLYNRACIYSLKGDKSNALADLKKAIAIDPSVKESAKKEEDFKNLFNDEDFKNLTK